MFDTHSTKITSPEKVFHEHKRAPTDESIGLAMEYEEKILQKITDKLLCKDNIVNISFFRVDDILNHYFVMKISINGNEYSNKFNFSFDIDKIVDDIVKWVAYKLVKPCFDDVFEAMHLKIPTRA